MRPTAFILPALVLLAAACQPATSESVSSSDVQSFDSEGPSFTAATSDDVIPARSSSTSATT